jgi:ankyrin repeat protein/uncharacterized protein YegL
MSDDNINIRNILVDLRCPITQDWLVDPICPPCCNRAFSRASLSQWLLQSSICPACSQPINNFDVATAPKNLTIASLVENARENSDLRPTVVKKHEWSASFTPIEQGSDIGRLTVNILDSRFSLRRSLFVLLVDTSGSMSGSPIEQVKSALRHIFGLSQHNELIKIVLITYESTAQLRAFDEETINSLRGGGGTNFRNAFQTLSEVLRGYICSNNPEDADRLNNVGSVSVVFMTDGQDCGDKTTLAADMRTQLEDVWISKEREITVHAVGFGQSCDKNLLESVRTVGTSEGTFRYAENNDGEDALCQKITGIYDICSRGSVQSITVGIGGDHQINLNIPINKHGNGQVSTWHDPIATQDGSSSINTVTIISDVDQGCRVDVELVNSTLLISRTMKDWVSYSIDQLANQIIEIAKYQDDSPDLKQFRSALLRQKVDDFRLFAREEDEERLDFIDEQIKQIAAGKDINLSKLSDMRFTSLFGLTATKKPNRKGKDAAHTGYSAPTTTAVALDSKPAFEHPLKKYSRNNEGTGRNRLQCLIMDQTFNHEPTRELQLLLMTDNASLTHCDNNGNNALMLAAYCGHSKIVSLILGTVNNGSTGNGIVSTGNGSGNDIINKVNNDDETALTLSIKKRGFHETMCILLDGGAVIPSGRSKGLQRFAIEHGYNRTAALLENIGEGVVSFAVDNSMSDDYIRYLYNKLITSSEGKEYYEQYFTVMLSKGPTALKDLIIDLLDRGVKPTISHVNQYCMPKKPDALDIPEYLELAQLLVSRNPELIKDVDESQESALFKSAKKGSLPHVKYFLDQGAIIDQPNEKLVTPLWCACYCRFPCIINELLDRGADIAWENENGNIPMFGICERGPRKIAELLIARGSPVEHVNKNGDTLILIACRNGQSDVLECLLEYVDEEYANKFAHIDDFNAAMAAAETGQGDCIHVLHKYGFNLELTTPTEDVKVLGGATALHIASYYGQLSAIRALLECGANPNARAMHGETALHIAVMQGYIHAVKLLSKYVDLTIEDNSNNTAAGYCRDRPEIRDLLVDPSLDSFMSLARGGFSETDSASALLLLKDHHDVRGSAKKFVNIKDHNGNTPLLEAVLHGNREMTATLIEIGADPTISNKLGMYPLTWAKHNRNPRLVKLLTSSTGSNDGNSARSNSSSSNSGSSNSNGSISSVVDQQLERLRRASDPGILFLGKVPNTIVDISKSGIVDRMALIPATPLTIAELDGQFASELPTLECSNTAVGTYFDKDEFADLQKSRLVWYAKAFTISLIAKGELVSPKDLLILCMYTNNPLVSKLINNSIGRYQYESKLIRDYTSCLYQSLLKLPAYQGEVFIGLDQVNRQDYMVGKEFSWGQFASATTLWRVAMEGTPSFATKSRKGVIFAIKSLTGRLVGQYSQFSFDSELIFLPFRKFKVYDWFHGDPVALGQPNIREHSYHIHHKSDSWMNVDQMVKSDKSLIIAVNEIP